MHLRTQVTDADIIDLFETVLQSPYANPMSRQFVLTAATKLHSRPAVSPAQRQRIATILSGFSTTPELEIQQRAVEFQALFSQRNDVETGVLERMPPPEIKATVLGTGERLSRSFTLLTMIVSENKPVGSTRADKDVSLVRLSLRTKDD